MRTGLIAVRRLARIGGPTNAVRSRRRADRIDQIFAAMHESGSGPSLPIGAACSTLAAASPPWRRASPMEGTGCLRMRPQHALFSRVRRRTREADVNCRGAIDSHAAGARNVEACVGCSGANICLR